MPMRSAWLCAFLLVAVGCVAPDGSRGAASSPDRHLVATLTATLDFRAPTSPKSPSDPVYVTITIPPPWVGRELQIGDVRVNYLRVVAGTGADTTPPVAYRTIYASSDTLPAAVLDATFKRNAGASTRYFLSVEVFGHDASFSPATLKFKGYVDVPAQAHLAKIELEMDSAQESAPAR